MTIYLDNNATTAVHPRVLSAMEPFLREEFGNPSSLQYEKGRRARRALDQARETISRVINCEPDEILFTSGGSEANTQAILADTVRATSRRIVTSTIEHDSVRRACAYARLTGAPVGLIPVGMDGIVQLDPLRDALAASVALVTVMWANNETGVLQPVPSIAELAHAGGALAHVDAVQALGKIEIDLAAIPIDLLTLSAHKVHGPKGVGALFVRHGVEIGPRIFGGPQERGLRAGTENVAGIAGFAAACAMLLERTPADRERVRHLRDALEEGLLARCPGAVVFGDRGQRVGNTLLIGWPGIDAGEVLAELDRRGICASSGSACTSQDPEPSHVLSAMGIAPALARSAVRFSLSVETTAEEIARVLQEMQQVIAELATHGEVLAWARGDDDD